MQTQIRLLLKKQSGQGLPCLLIKEFVNSSSNNLKKCWKFENIFRTHTVAKQGSMSCTQLQIRKTDLSHGSGAQIIPDFSCIGLSVLAGGISAVYYQGFLLL